MTVESPPRPLMITRWARQSARAPAALAPGYARLDERSFADLAAETAHFAGDVRFFDSANAEEGNWQTLLTADASILVALIATFDMGERAEQIRRLLRRLCRRKSPERREEALHGVVSELLALVAVFDRWIADAERVGRSLPEAPAVRLVDWAARDLLGPRLRRLVAILAAAERAGFFAGGRLLVVDHLHARWRVELIHVDEAWEWGSGRFWLDHVAEPVADAVEGFLGGLETLTAAAREALDESLEHERHAPQVGLLFAFLNLFRHAQGRLNALPARMAGFWHRELVGARAREARPDRVFLALRAIPGRASATVREGHLFEAGEDEAGAPIRFAADKSLPVTGARIDEIRLWRPDSQSGGLRGFEAGAFPIAKMEAAAAAFAGAPLPAAQVGLIVAGDALEAEAGKFGLTLTLGLTGVDWTSEAGGAEFESLVRDAFRISVATPEGWVEVPAFDAGSSTVDGDRALAVFGFSPGTALGGMAGGPCGVGGPAVRLLLVQEPCTIGGRTIFPLEIFGKARVERLQVDVGARDLQGLQVSTSAGAAGGIAGVPPFGIPAARGGWLQIAHPALLGGAVERLALSLEWAELPPNADGLAGYYRDYVVGLDRELHGLADPLFANDLFRVRLEAPLGGGRAAADLPLFPDAAPAGPLPAVSTFEMWGGIAEACAPGPEGAVRLTLTEPAYAFGDLLYPANVAWATALAARDAQEHRRREGLFGHVSAVASAEGKPRIGIVRGVARWLKHAVAFLTLKDISSEDQELAEREEREEDEEALQDSVPRGDFLTFSTPNAPWRPTLAGLVLDVDAHYAMGREDRAGPLRLYHVLPLDPPEEVCWAEQVPLVAGLPDRACFDLSVRDRRPGAPLSILFRLAANAPEQPAPVEWAVGSGPGWRPLEVEDGSDNLARAGIVTFPPSGRSSSRCHLRGAMAGGLPPIERLYPDALSATRLISGSETSLSPVPAGTVAAIAGIAGIAGLDQPLASFGGRAAESSGTVSARAGERLRHGGRPLTAWDHERILLDRFPELAAVRVLPARGADGEPKPGALLAVVIPTASEDGQRPRLREALRAAIAAELQSVASPFAAISVAEADLVPVDVQADVAFSSPEAASGLEGELRAFLMAGADGGPDLPDGAGAEDLADALVRFIRARPNVDAVADVIATLPPHVPGQRWLVPLPDVLTLRSLTRERLGA